MQHIIIINQAQMFKNEGILIKYRLFCYQESKCYGLISDYNSQEKCLKEIILDLKGLLILKDL